MFFCFKQKTAYEVRISDWSSDVCSSDLAGHADLARRIVHAILHRRPRRARQGRKIGAQRRRGSRGIGRRCRAVLHRLAGFGLLLLALAREQREQSARDDDAADDQAGARSLVLVLFGRPDVAIAIAEFSAAPVVHPAMARGIAPLPPGVATSTKPAHQLDPIVRRDIALLIAVVARFTANRPRIIFDRLPQRRGITAKTGRE